MDLTTTYLGLTLKNPLVASACSLTGTPDGARRIEQAGCAALVVRSIFEEQLPGATGADPAAIAAQLENLRAIRQAVSIPVIASINCRAHGSWSAFAREIEATGVAALELNLYDIPEDVGESSAGIEARQLDLMRAVTAATRLPVAVKISPYYTAMIPFCRGLEAAGARGLVLFNRFMQPDINMETGHLRYNVNFSHREDLRLPLRWTAILRDALKTDIALSGGVHEASDAVQAILVGANAVCLCSVLYQRGKAEPIAEILDGMRHWLASKGHVDLNAIRGRMRNVGYGGKTGFERAHYVKTLGSAK